MSIIGKTLSAIKEIIKTPWLLNHVSNDNSVWQHKVSTNYNLPNGLPTIQLDELFPQFSEELASFSFMCAIFIRDKFTTQPLKVNANPTRTFEVSLKSKKI